MIKFSYMANMTKTAPKSGERIERDHGFINKLNMVVKGRKFFYARNEKSYWWVKINRSAELDKAFEDRNWPEFEDAYIRA